MTLAILDLLAVLDECNMLNNHLMSGKTIDALKRKLEEFMDSAGRWG